MSETQTPTLGNGKICYLEIPATDIDVSVKFYETVFGFKPTPGASPSTRRLSDGAFDIVLMKADNPKHHHIGIKVFDRNAFVDGLARNGADIVPDRSGATLFRAPDGTLAEIVTPMG